MDMIEAQFKITHLEEEAKAYRMEIARLRQVIGCAICAHCGDAIADREWSIDEDERLVHEDCLKEIAADNSQFGAGA